MRENDILKLWSNEKVCFWGASIKASSLIKRILIDIPQIKPFCIFDNNVEKNLLKIFNYEIPVIKLQDFLSKSDLSQIKLVLCVSNKKSYQEIEEILFSYGLVYGRDFIDGYRLNLLGLKEIPYEQILPHATYAPWRCDDAFITIYEKIKNNTLVDIYRCYELWDMVFQTSKCIEGDYLEVGVWRGGTGALIAGAVEEAKINAKIYLADTFEGIVKCSEYDDVYVGGELADTSEETVNKLLCEMNLQNVKVCKGIFPEDVVDTFMDKKYRLVHIDVDVYESAKDIFEFIWPRVVSQGMVVFDDYGFFTTKGVTRLCNELKLNITDGVFVSNLNGHATFIKI